MNERTTGYWIDAPGTGSLREVVLPTASGESVALATICTGISPGTERLVGLGRVPACGASAMACIGMQGQFSLPLLYGYSLVGAVVGGAAAGRRAFVMHPHQQRALVPVDRVVWLPDAVPSARATLFPNLETAQNAAWDAAAATGARIAVVGGGALGLLLTFVLAREHENVTLVEADAERRRFASRLPWLTTVLAPEQMAAGVMDLAFHTTGRGVGLQLALDTVGFEGTVVDLSWYGNQDVTLRLGDGFHWQRKRIVASQVGTIAASHRAAGPRARTAAVLALLHDARLDALLTAPIPFATLPAWFARLYRGEPTAPCPVVDHQSGPGRTGPR